MSFPVIRTQKPTDKSTHTHIERNNKETNRLKTRFIFQHLFLFKYRNIDTLIFDHYLNKLDIYEYIHIQTYEELQLEI